MLWLLPPDSLLPPRVRPWKLNLCVFSMLSSQRGLCLVHRLQVHPPVAAFPFSLVQSLSHSMPPRGPPPTPRPHSLPYPPQGCLKIRCNFTSSSLLTLCWKSLLYPFFPSYLLDTCFLHFVSLKAVLSLLKCKQTKQLFLYECILRQASHSPTLGFAKVQQ